MDRGWYFRLMIVLGVCGLGAYLIYPSYVYFYQADEKTRDDQEVFCASMPSWASCKKVNLGLDLQGGVPLGDGSDGGQGFGAPRGPFGGSTA